MCHLEPPDSIDVSCSWCGESEQIEHKGGSVWGCSSCYEYFSDGADLDDPDWDFDAP